MAAIEEINDWQRAADKAVIQSDARIISEQYAEIARLRVANARLRAALDRIMNLRESQFASVGSVAFAARHIARTTLFPEPVQPTQREGGE